jgi:hypothetical protein
MLGTLHPSMLVNPDQPQDGFTPSGICMPRNKPSCLYRVDPLSLQLDPGIFIRLTSRYLVNHPNRPTLNLKRRWSLYHDSNPHIPIHPPS